MTNAHIGSSFDDFLEEDGIREEVEAIAVKRVIAWQIAQEMEKQGPKQDRDGSPDEDKPGAT